MAESISLPPWEKWMRFRRFPVKMVLHLLLVVCVTTQVIALNTQDAGQYRSFRQTWRRFFFPESYIMSGNPFHRVYSVDSTVDAVDHAVRSFYAIETSAVDHILRDGDALMVTTTLDAARPEAAGGTIASSTHDYPLANSSDLGPFSGDGEAVRAFLRTARLVEVHFPLRTYGLTTSWIVGGSYRTCYAWDVVLTFDFALRGDIKMTVGDRDVQACEELAWGEAFTHRLLWLDLVIALGAALYFALAVKALARSASRFFLLELHYTSLAAGQSAAAAAEGGGAFVPGALARCQRALLLCAIACSSAVEATFALLTPSKTLACIMKNKCKSCESNDEALSRERSEQFGTPQLTRPPRSAEDACCQTRRAMVHAAAAAAAAAEDEGGRGIIEATEGRRCAEEMAGKWATLTAWDKVSFFDLWYITSICACLCCVASSGWNLATTRCVCEGRSGGGAVGCRRAPYVAPLVPPSFLCLLPPPFLPVAR